MPDASGFPLIQKPAAGEVLLSSSAHTVRRPVRAPRSASVSKIADRSQMTGEIKEYKASNGKFLGNLFSTGVATCRRECLEWRARNPHRAGVRDSDSVRTTEGSTTTTLVRGGLGLIVTIRQEVLGVPRSSALDVAPKTWSSWNTRPFSRPGDNRTTSARLAAAQTAAAEHYPARVGPTTPTHATSCKNCSTLPRQGHLSAPGGNIVWLLGTYQFPNALGPRERFT